MPTRGLGASVKGSPDPKRSGRSGLDHRKGRAADCGDRVPEANIGLHPRSIPISMLPSGRIRHEGREPQGLDVGSALIARGRLRHTPATAAGEFRQRRPLNPIQ